MPLAPWEISVIVTAPQKLSEKEPVCPQIPHVVSSSLTCSHIDTIYHVVDSQRPSPTLKLMPLPPQS
jgi:hypothetical protein